ncbi:MAG: hypothetical protein ACRDIA_07680, partial [Actinomycetota bacterium]
MMRIFKLLGLSKIPLVFLAVILLSAASWGMMATRPAQDEPVVAEAETAPAVEVEETLLPAHREPPPPPPPAPPAPEAPKPAVKAAAKPAPKPKPAPVTVAAAPAPAPAPAPAGDLGMYGGLGAWVDRFDIIDWQAAIDKMAANGVRTLYFQTGRYKDPEDLFDPARLGHWIDTAHARGISVVCWYVPGFGDMDRDLRRTRAALDFVSPGGGRCDGFAPDIETGDFAGDRARFNAGVEEYTRRIREVAGGRVLGAIVVDAKNNERAPGKWAGFPWRAIGEVYDVILPMAYWTVTKGGNCAVEYDVHSYINQVIDKTNALMGRARPYHMIGGIANCQTVGETQGFVRAVKERGLLGGSLYD